MRATAVALLSFSFACSSTPWSAVSSAPEDSGVPAATGGVDASAVVTDCADPRARPDMACGTLAWTTNDVKIRPCNHHVTLAHTRGDGAQLYVLGGYDGPSRHAVATVDRMAIGADGSLQPATAEPALPIAIAGFTGAIAADVVVVAGGVASGIPIDKSWFASIREDGSLAPWQAGGSIAHARFHAGSFVAGNAVYVAGGFDSGTLWNDVVRATVGQDGALSPWSSAGALPGPRSHFSVTFVDGYVYVAGGLDQREVSGAVPPIREVARARVGDDGALGAWATMTPLPVAVSSHASFFHGGYLYVAGGLSGGPNLVEEKRVWRAPIDDEHALGNWERVASLPVARAHVHQLPVVRGRVYSVGGALDVALDSTDAIHVGAFGDH